MTTSSKIILGIAGAAVAGVAIGLLVSPKKTKKILENFTCSIADLSSQLKDKVDKTAHNIQQNIEEATA
jgi:proteasome assembly chaperone (PAC2) family protein